MPKGEWRNLDKYYPTLLYFAVGNLAYEYIAHVKFHLWKMNGDGLFPEIIADFIALFLIVIPAILIYLSKYPKTPKERIIHIAKWILIFTIVEWVGGKYFNAINYENGWNIWWSFLFNLCMFPMLRLHYISFKKALLLSVPFTLFYLLWFHYI
ncbi:CBO0543 family protein [Neobacillus soli]|uniref:CBO0543 family protein n=1 Tax=Neobacillus soli TaxID=220688 RepID=UPI002467B585|nr:CBO0543 family protein [Neobacillus soli]